MRGGSGHAPSGGRYDGGLLGRRCIRFSGGAGMRARLEEMMRAYGQTVTLVSKESGEEAVFPAFLQPVLKEREAPPIAVTPLGAVSVRRWLYIGPAGREIRPGDRVRFNALGLVVQEAEAVCFRSEVLYRRAVLRQEKERAE